MKNDKYAKLEIKKFGLHLVIVVINFLVLKKKKFFIMNKNKYINFVKEQWKKAKDSGEKKDFKKFNAEIVKMWREKKENKNK